MLGFDQQFAGRYLGSAVSSHSMMDSLGPAGAPGSTLPYTRRRAAATYRFPGPTILSTLVTVSVP